MLPRGWNDRHVTNYLLSHHNQRQSDDNMSLQKPFSRLKEKVKHRLGGGRPEPETGGMDTGGEGVGGMGSVPQPSPHLIAQDGHDHPQSGGEADVGGGLVGSADPLPSDDPGFVPVSKIGRDGEGSEATIEGREVGGGNLHLRLGVGPSQGGNNTDEERVHQVNPSPSESNESTTTYWSLPSSDNIDISAVPDPVQQALGVSEGESGPADADKLGWRSTASAMAKSFFRMVKESQNAYPPLKSIAECLYIVLNNCEVWSPTYSTYNSHERYSERKWTNKP